LSCIQGILSSVCSEVETEIKQALKGLLKGPMIRGYLPQTWILRTERETVTFSVDSMGNARATNGMSPNPDVIIEWKHDYTAMALRNRSKAGIPPGEQPKIEFKTGKGKTAFGFIRGRLGL
jgi:hypothetical protein